MTGLVLVNELVVADPKSSVVGRKSQVAGRVSGVLSAQHAEEWRCRQIANPGRQQTHAPKVIALQACVRPSIASISSTYAVRQALQTYRLKRYGGLQF